MNRNESKFVLLCALLLAAPAWSAESAAPAAACPGVTDLKSKSRQIFDGKTLMTNLNALEARGEAGFHLQFKPATIQCAFEKFEVGGSPVTAILSPFEKGDSTLHWRFQVGGAEPREIVVLYDGMTSLVAKKTVFFVAEERKGSISYYAMFRDQPTYAKLKPIVVSIVDGSAEPLATVRWPAGAKEPVIEAYSKRLK